MFKIHFNSFKIKIEIANSLFSIIFLFFFLQFFCSFYCQENSFNQPLFKKYDDILKESNKHILGLACPKIDTIKIAIIGLGNRGMMAIERLPQIPTVKIVAISDIDSNKVNKALKYLGNKKLILPEIYYGSNDWELICQSKDIDLVYVCTHWELHAPIAIYAMEHDKHVAVEVPAALTVKECWKLVKTAEKTRKHCIQLENCIYDFFEITVNNMAQLGVFGDVIHTEGAYIHDLRSLNFSNTYYWDNWRLKRLQQTNGNTYPTHGLGPLAHLLNIHRGDKMTHLVSMSSNQFGLTKYAKEKLKESDNWKGSEFEKGDMNTTLIKTAKGKTIMLQHDVTSPRPYTRLFTVSGTEGFAQKYPKKSLAFEPNSHQSISKKQISDSLLKYEPLPIKEIKEKAKRVGGHGGMDYIMDYRLIYCLNNGLPLDQDVYDAAEWSSIIELSKKSVRSGSKPVKIPDFTRGNWNHLKMVNYFLK